MRTDATLSTLPAPEQDQLTEMERVLWGKLAEGLTFRQIDSALHLEAGTAHRMRKHLFRKIGARTRHEASATLQPISHIRWADLNQFLIERFGLAKRERDVLALLLYFPNLSRKEIGVRLGICDNTTRLTINRINKKLGVSSRAKVVHAVYTLLRQEKGITFMQTNETNTQEHQPAIKETITELTTRWGYRDISALIAAWKKHYAEQYPDEPTNATTYLCVLQTPEGGPVYCRSAKRLFKELEAARSRNEPYAACPAPDPAQNLWMVVGNFDIGDEDEEDE